MSDDDTETLDEASSEDAEVSQQPSEDAEAEFHPFEEIEDSFGDPSPAVYVRGRDGMPTQADQSEKSDIPVLSKDTLVCMADKSKFVLRDRWGEVFAEFEPAEVEQAPNGVHRVPARLALERCGSARRALRYVGALVRNARVLSLSEPVVEVEPIRPQCKHYVRQKGQLRWNPEHKDYARLCSARRTTEGTFMTVKDTGIWACSMRDPMYLPSEHVLDDFDKLKIEQGANRRYLPIVTPVAKDDDAPAGIFKG